MTDVSTDPGYAQWRARLDNPALAVTAEPDLGFYRGFGQRPPAFAVFASKHGVLKMKMTHYNAAQKAVIDRTWSWDNPEEQAKMEEWWLKVAKRPVAQATYWEAVRNELYWPDIDYSVEQAELPKESPAVKILLNKLAAGEADYKVIEDDEVNAAAQSYKDAVAKLRLHADKTRKAQIEPHLEAQKRINSGWKPVIEMAEAIEARIKRAQEAYLTLQARRLREAEEARRREEARKAREEEEARLAELARQREEEKDEEDLLADLIGHNNPPPDLTPAAPVAEPPAIAPDGNGLAFVPTQVRGGTGRAASVRMEKYVAEVTDWDALWQHFKNEPAVREALTTLAGRAVAAGFLSIPGIRVDERVRLKG